MCSNKNIGDNRRIFKRSNIQISEKFENSVFPSQLAVVMITIRNCIQLRGHKLLIQFPGFSPRRSPAKSFLDEEEIKPRRLSFAESTIMTERNIKNEAQLNNYMKKCDEYEKKALLMAFKEIKYSAENSYVQPIMHFDESAPSFPKTPYQKSCWQPPDTSTDIPEELQCTENIRSKLKVTDKMLTLWCERLRKWICETIVCGIVKEIELINERLCSIGFPELQIGIADLLTLKQVAVSKAEIFPTLTYLLPYLNMTLNQEYLVERLQQLSQGGCMRDFKWNAGGCHREHPWTPELPTDSAIVMHLFCSYMDTKLPFDPRSVDGRAFSYKYFKRAPEKPGFCKGNHYIYQSKTNPPHYVVVIDEEIYGPPKGRNNFFYSILLLLHYAKNFEHGMLGKVNLGQSGINLLWVLEN